MTIGQFDGCPFGPCIFGRVRSLAKQYDSLWGITDFESARDFLREGGPPIGVA